MPPQLATPVAQAVTATSSVSNYLSAQWHSPSDILSVLLLLGPEIVQTAIAQLSGRLVTPVPFSFGWVTYSCSMLLSAIEGGQLMPNYKSPILVVNAENGHRTTTASWVLCKLFDSINDEIDKEMANEEPHTPLQVKNKRERQKNSQHPQKPWESLRIIVYKVNIDPKLQQGVPTLDWVWFSGFAVILVQLILSFLPWILNGDWAPFLLTSSGTCLALCGASLPQWREEKWASRPMGGSTVTLTRGNGTRTAVVLLAEHRSGLNFEVLARNARVAVPSFVTRCATGSLALFWILLLVTVAGLKEHTWYLLGIGLLGSMHTLVAAGASRDHDCLGVHINKYKTFADSSLAPVLRKVQEEFETHYIGASLLNVFFPGGFRAKDDDLSFWRGVLQSWSSPNAFGEYVHV